MPTPALNAILFGGGPNPVLSADFARSAYRLGTGRYTSPSDIPGWSFTRASVGTALDSSGTIISFASGQPRITDLGLLIEEARTNSFLNSAVGVTQSVTTTAGSWTLSFYGTGSITMSGGASGTLNGTGANNRVSLPVTALAIATLLTVSGSCTNVMFEAGAYASSVIVTVGAAATRAADVASIGGLSATLSQAGTAAAEFVPSSLVTNAPVFTFGSAGAIEARLDGGAPVGRALRANIASVAATANSGTAGVLNRLALSYTAGAYLLGLNGGVVAVGSDVATLTSTAAITLGRDAAGLSGSMYLRRIQLLPNISTSAQVQAMSAGAF